MELKVSKIEKTSAQLILQLEHPEFFAQKISNLKPESKRYLEVVAVRVLLKEMLGKEVEIGYTDKGAPYFVGDDSRYLSISHTNDYVAAIVDDKPVGIDIERIGNRVERVKSRYLQESEEALIASTPDPLVSLHLAWSAKEAAFKILGEEFYDLQNLTCIRGFDFTDNTLLLDVKGRESIVFKFDITESYVLCYSI